MSTTEQKLFTTTFEESNDEYLSHPGSVDGSDLLVSSDQTIMTAPVDTPWLGAMKFDGEYHDHDGWETGHIALDGERKDVYVFDSTHSLNVVVDADKIETVADYLGIDPSDVADKATVFRSFPISIQHDSERVIICPVLNESDVTLDD